MVGTLMFRILVVAAYLCLATPLWAQSTSVRSGPWSNAATWGGVLPTGSVTIAAGHTVTLDTSVNVGDVIVNGTLKVSRTQSTVLTTTCNVLVHGTFDQGTVADPIPTGVTHALVFALSQAAAARFVVDGNHTTNCGLHVMGAGRWTAHGYDVHRTWGKLAADAAAGTTTLTVEGDISRWRVGSQIVISQTSPADVITVNAQGNAENTRSRYETELRIIAAVNGSTLTLTEPLQYNHVGSGLERGEVGLLSHNVVIRTDLENAAATIRTDVRGRLFAHIMIMDQGRADVRYLEIRRMGHYLIRGAYALHFHRLYDGARGTVVRGVSFLETGFRCTNIHESNGVLVEDTVCVFSGNGAAHLVQVDDPSVQADSAYVHNLVVGHQPKHFNDRASSLPGERLRGAAGFWPGASEHEAHVGNVAVGGSPISEYITGHHWPENVTSTAGTIARVHVANEVHAVTQAGFHSWQNRGVGHDIVAAHAWGINAGSGILHGAYGFPLRWYRARLVGNRIAYDGTVVTGFLQDSLIEGRGLTAPALLVPDTGVAVGSYSIQPHPMRPWHLLRNTIRDLTPAANGTRGAGVRQSHDLCTQGALELKALTRDCTANFFTIKQNTFGPGIQPLDFGWSTNANTHWITDTAVLLRRDMATPRGEFPPKLVKAATSFDQASGALSTPLSSLPPTIVWTGLLSYRNRPHRDYVLQTAYDEPPTISLDVVRTGTIVRLTAIASADTTRVEFWQNWTLLGSDDQAPFELTADLNAPPSDTLAPQRYAFVYARAFDGTIIDAGGGEGTGPGPAGYAQRAYSRVVQFGPEVLLGQVVPPGPPQPPPQPPSPPQPPTIDQLIKQIAALEASLKASQAATAAALAERDAARTQRDSALAQVTSLQAQISKLQAELSTAQAARTTAETALTALRARLAQVLTKLAEVQAILSAAVITPGSSASTAATASTAYDVSPAITSGMERKGTAVALIAAVNPGESRLDFWQRVLANRTRAPFELTTDLAVPYGNRRVVLGPEVRHAEAPSPGPEAQSQPPTIDQLLAQVAALEASLKTSQAATTAALAERDAARTARDTALTQVTSLQTQITKLQGDLSATQAARTAAETARAGLQARLAQALAKLAEVQALLNQ